MVTVAVEGNRRRGSMSIDEIQQCVLDVCAWFTRCSSIVLEDGDPATPEDIQTLEKTCGGGLPKGFKTLCAQQNGQIWFYDKQALTHEAMCKMINDLDSESPKGWREGLVPFASDCDSNMFVLDTQANGAVFEFDSDEGLGDEVGHSFSAFLEAYRNDMLENKFEFIEDMGVVEKMGGGGACTSPRGSRSSYGK